MNRWIILSLIIAQFISTTVSASVLEGLAKPRDYASGRVSSYDTTGGNADGGQLHPIQQDETRVIADIAGPGEVAHIWFTLAPFDKAVLTRVILRMYWDGEKNPSVETPIGAFFGLGHGKEYSFDSLPISVGNKRGLNCFFPMPFNRQARITLENQSGQPLQATYYYVDYKKFDKPNDDIRYFHAQYRQARPCLSKDNYVALEATGSGHYVGMFYYIRSNSGGWWGEGDDQTFIDGSKEPTLFGTGMEDYFCHAWGMAPGQCSLRFGAPLFELNTTEDGNENTAYRWHIEDAIAFKKSIRVTHEHGSNNDRNDDFFSVAFWYQTHPHADFPPLPSNFERLSFADKKIALIKEKKYAECRALCADYMARAVDAEAKAWVVADIMQTYALEGNPAQAAQTAIDQTGPIPVEGWTTKIKERAEHLGVQGVVFPDSQIWLVNGGDGRPILDTIDGTKCFRTAPSTQSPLLYFKVHSKELRNTEKNLLLDIEYYDTGSGAILVEYNSAFDGDDIFTKYHSAELFIMTGAKGWKTVQIELPRAKLSGSQNSGADFRIQNPKGALAIKSIKVSAK